MCLCHQFVCVINVSSIPSRFLILTRVYITINVCGLQVGVGWQFGTLEGICVTICVGFSCDFIIHIAVAYNEAPPDMSRYDRTRKALGEMGVSVTG